MELLDALAMRRTASGFAEAAPPRELVERIIEAATWAPNHRKTEPWRFHVLAGAAREELGDRVAAAMRNDEGAGDAQVDSARKKLVRSPVIVVVTQPGSPADPVRDLEDYAAACCATQNLLLAAHGEGLASKWSTGAMAMMPAVFEYLGIERDDRVVGFVYLGYPADGAEPRPPARQPASVNWRGM
ncbi:MAG: nitroreductase [Chloroflexi bacterium]|nr:nitroreductase [Chloroflexota bacterium]MDA1147267.1 nitroreductase [Chloroflexota bacterium]